MYRDVDQTNISKQEISQLFKTFIQNDKDFLAKNNNLSTIRKSPKRDRSRSNNRGSPQPRESPISKPKPDPNMNQTFSRPKPSFINRSQVLTQLSRIMNKKYENSDEFRYIIKKIFEFYASFADRLNTENLKLANLYKFADNASLLNKEITHRTFDRLFYKHCQKQASINFEQFLLLLVDVGALKYPNLDHKDAFMELFNSHLKGLYKTIFKDTDFGEYETILREPVYEETFAVLRIIGPMMAKLHSHYFCYEYQKLDSVEIENKCEGCAQTFLKDFEICPQLISFGLAHTVLRELLNSDSNQLFDIVGGILGLEYDVGVEFTLSKFLIFLLRIAMIWGFQQYQGRFFGENAEISQQDVLIMLLEKMEISKGCLEFKEDYSTQKFSLLPKKLYEHKTTIETGAYSSYTGGGSGLSPQARGRRKLSGNSSDFLPLTSVEDSVLHHQSKRRNYGNENRRSKTPSPLKWAKSSLRTSRVIDVFEKNKESLNALFRKYCVVVLGENETSRTRAFGIVKLFKNAKLMRDIGNQEDIGVQENRFDTDDENPQARLIKHMELDLFLRELTSQNLLRANNLKILSQNQNEENIVNKDPKDRCDSFLDFLKSIQYVSSHVYPQLELDMAISYVIENHLLPLLKEKKLPSDEIELRDQVKKIVNLLSEPELVDVLGRLKKCLGYFYKAYSKSNGKMSIEDFVHFNRTFKVIPDIISKAKLMNVLGTLSLLSKGLETGTKRSRSPLEINKRKGGLIIDENLFVEALALIAARLETNLSGGILDKLIFVLEKIKEGCYLSANERILAPTELKKSKKEIQELINYTKSRYLNIIQSGLTTNVHTVNNNKAKLNYENFDDIFIVHK